MGGGSVPAPAPPPNPLRTAEANERFYGSSRNTYVAKQDDLAMLEERIRSKYQPRQRKLEADLAAMDTRRLAESGLQTERELGPQRTLEALRRQFEMNPQAFAMNRAMGDQQATAFARLYGANPAGSVPGNVSNNAGIDPVDYLGAI